MKEHTCKKCGSPVDCFSGICVQKCQKEMESKTLLWLDDIRNPNLTDWLLSYAPDWYERREDVVWVKSYEEFVEWIEENGLPAMVCFDHDLADIHYDPSTWREGFVYHEKTGLDCAKWLVDYCIDNDLPLPDWNIQSANPVGAENIRAFLTNFTKHQ